jgi:hypothetical protein
MSIAQETNLGLSWLLGHASEQRLFDQSPPGHLPVTHMKLRQPRSCHSHIRMAYHGALQLLLLHQPLLPFELDLCHLSLGPGRLFSGLSDLVLVVPDVLRIDCQEKLSVSDVIDQMSEHNRLASHAKPPSRSDRTSRRLSGSTSVVRLFDLYRREYLTFEMHESAYAQLCCSLDIRSLYRHGL